MKSFINRPLAVFSLAFYISACIFAAIHSITALIILSVAGAAAALILTLTRVGKLPTLVLLALALAAVFSVLTVHLPEKKYESLIGEKSIGGEVVKIVWQREEKSGFIADVDIDGTHTHLYIISSSYISRGDIFTASALIAPISDDSAYYRTEGTYLQAEEPELSITGKRSGHLSDAFYYLNRRLSAVFTVKLGRDMGSFASSVILGNRSNFPLRLYADLESMGITHLIALSGLHLSVICSLVYMIMSPFSRKTKLISTACTAVFYMFLTDFSPSIVRAGVMLLVFTAVTLIKKSTDGATALGITAMLVTLFSPEAVYDLGFKLSLSAVAGVYSGLTLIRGKWDRDHVPLRIFLKKLATPFAVGFGASIFVLPVLLSHKMNVTFAGALVTIPLSALLTLIMWMLIATLMLPFDFIADTAEYLISVFDESAHFLADIGDFRLLTESYLLCSLICTAAVICIVLGTAAESKRTTAGFLLASAVFLCGFTGICASGIDADKCTVVEEECYNGSVLIVQNKGITLVIDKAAPFDSTWFDVKEKVRSLGDAQIDALVIPIPDEAHLSALANSRVLFDLDVIFMPYNEISKQFAYQTDGEVLIIYYEEGQTLTFGDISFTPLASSEFSVTVDEKKLSFS